MVLRGGRLPAAISVGTNPTFEGRERTVEAYILDFDEDIYGVELGVEFVERIRGMERFERVSRTWSSRWAGTCERTRRDPPLSGPWAGSWYPGRHAPAGAV